MQTNVTRKTCDTYARAVQQLNRYFKIVNEGLFDGELETPTITIQSSVGAYGHITVGKVWHAATDKGESYELNLSADYLNRPIEDLIATLVHECVHLYNLMHNVKDTSNNCVYHNKKFKEEAEKRLLHIEHHDRYGWTITSPTEQLINWIIDNGLTEILINRGAPISWNTPGIGGNGSGPAPTVSPIKPKGSNSIKWVCPQCGAIIRSTKEVNVICGDCNEKFVRA